MTTIGIFVAVNLDAFAAPIEYVRADRVSPLYNRLRQSPNAVVVEFPFFPADKTFHNAPYLLNATRNWRPMVNGYSGIVPPSYVDHARELSHFPDGRSIAALKALGVTHVFVHDEDFRKWTGNESAEAVRHSTDLHLLGTDEDVALYELVQPSR